jgi:hypothetical protein
MIDEPKDPNEMTTDEAADYLFPPEVIEHLKTAVRDDDEENNGHDDSSSS